MMDVRQDSASDSLYQLGGVGGTTITDDIASIRSYRPIITSEMGTIRQQPLVDGSTAAASSTSSSTIAAHPAESANYHYEPTATRRLVRLQSSNSLPQSTTSGGSGGSSAAASTLTTTATLPPTRVQSKRYYRLPEPLVADRETSRLADALSTVHIYPSEVGDAPSPNGQQTVEDGSSTGEAVRRYLDSDRHANDEAYAAWIERKRCSRTMVKPRQPVDAPPVHRVPTRAVSAPARPVPVKAVSKQQQQQRVKSSVPSTKPKTSTLPSTSTLSKPAPAPIDRAAQAARSREAYEQWLRLKAVADLQRTLDEQRKQTRLALAAERARHERAEKQRRAADAVVEWRVAKVVLEKKVQQEKELAAWRRRVDKERKLEKSQVAVEQWMAKHQKEEQHAIAERRYYPHRKAWMAVALPRSLSSLEMEREAEAQATALSSATRQSTSATMPPKATVGTKSHRTLPAAIKSLSLKDKQRAAAARNLLAQQRRAAAEVPPSPPALYAEYSKYKQMAGKVFHRKYPQLIANGDRQGPLVGSVDAGTS